MLIGMGRLGASGSTAISCTSPNYWDSGLNTCCAPLGTAPAADPCSIVNQAGFLSAQAADVGPLASDGVPVSSGTGSGAEELAEVAGYDQNVQIAAMQCWNNPGLSTTDTLGTAFTCPAASVDDNGIYVSAYTPGQLAAMLSSTLTPSASVEATLPGNSPNILQQYTDSASTATPAVKLNINPGATNTSAGSSSSGSSSTDSGSTAGSGSTSTSTSTSSSLSFLTDDDLISGVPNWAVAFGALAALMILPSLLGGRR